MPLDSEVVRVPGFTLTMSTAGVPYQEPSFASIHPFPFKIGENDPAGWEHCNFEAKETGQVTLLGTAYLVTPEQYKRILASEGGGIAYREAGVLVHSMTRNSRLQQTRAHEKLTSSESVKRMARTLITVIPRRPTPRPSHRYMVCEFSNSSTPEANLRKTSPCVVSEVNEAQCIIEPHRGRSGRVRVP